MTRRERLMATMRGETVDRPAVSFYELNGLDENYNDPDPLCLAALLFDMATYTVTAMMEPELFHKLLKKFAHATISFLTTLTLSTI